MKVGGVGGQGDSVSRSMGMPGYPSINRRMGVPQGKRTHVGDVDYEFYENDYGRDFVRSNCQIA
jgi:hypothetical protein